MKIHHSVGPRASRFLLLLPLSFLISAAVAAAPLQSAYLKASNAEANDGFGISLAIFDNTLVVGATGEDSTATGVNGNETLNFAMGAGAAYVFVREATGITQQAYLKPSNTESLDSFGYSVAVNADTILVGAPNEDSSAYGLNGNGNNNTASASGAAYVFVREAGSWSQQAYLKASNTGANDNFGWTVAVSGDTAVVGAYGESSNATGVNGNQTDNFGTSSGAAYVFVRSGGQWVQQAYLKASNTGLYDNFGWSVAISGDTIVVGAYGEGSDSIGINGDGSNNRAVNSGAAYVFTRTGTDWTQQAYLKASNTGADDRFGYSVAISGDTIVVGALWEDGNGVGGGADNTLVNSGAAYVFKRTGTTWAQEGYLKASNPGPDDRFGWSVGISGDVVVAGAPYEDSAAVGVNGVPDEVASGSGAAYTFRRSGTSWIQSAYLKASNTAADDQFGAAVAVSQDSCVIGARQEDGASTGVNGDEASNAATNAGAAYLFEDFFPVLSARQIAGHIVLDWAGRHQLQSAPSATGSFTNVLEPMAGPWTNTSLQPAAFFRLLE